MTQPDTGPHSGSRPGPCNQPIVIDDPLCGHLPGERHDESCAYWRGVALGEYAPPVRWSVTPDGVEASRG